VPGDLLGGRVDWLSITVGARAAERLCATSERASEGKHARGFRKSELRTVAGGEAWRKWEPWEESQRFGYEYECWEYSGFEANCAACAVRSLAASMPGQVRPSRADVAFDFGVDERYRSCDWAAAAKPFAAANRITMGISGQGEIFTHYVGASTSARRIRCYRKDLQSQQVAFEIGPMLRVELVLKDEQARAWWPIWERDVDEAKRSAGEHIRRMAGCRVLAEAGEIPELELCEDIDPAQLVFQFVQQHGSWLQLLMEKGVDIGRLIKLMQLKRWHASNWSRHRSRRRRLAAVDLADLEQIVEQMIARDAMSM
jgi:hypothetical protein